MNLGQPRRAHRRGAGRAGPRAVGPTGSGVEHGPLPRRRPHASLPGHRAGPAGAGLDSRRRPSRRAWPRPSPTSGAPARDRRPGRRHRHHPDARPAVLLHRTLRSVRAQEDVDLEVLVVDDGSADDTGPSSRRWATRASAFSVTPARGVSAARNTGIAAATAPWLAFVDDDDLWAPGKLRAQLDALAADARRPAGPARGRSTSTCACQMSRWDLPPRTADVGDLLLRQNRVPGGGSGVLAVARADSAVGGFDEAISNIADWDFYIRLGCTRRWRRSSGRTWATTSIPRAWRTASAAPSAEYAYLQVKYGDASGAAWAEPEQALAALPRRPRLQRRPAPHGDAAARRARLTRAPVALRSRSRPARAGPRVRTGSRGPSRGCRRPRRPAGRGARLGSPPTPSPRLSRQGSLLRQHVLPVRVGAEAQRADERVVRRAGAHVGPLEALAADVAVQHHVRRVAEVVVHRQRDAVVGAAEVPAALGREGDDRRQHQGQRRWPPAGRRARAPRPARRRSR